MKWFKHDSNALHDAKIEKLIIRYGIAGYGLYFACVEMIAEKLSAENMSFELEHDAELLAHKFKIDSKLIEEIMKYCIALNLFQYSEESNKIFCQALSRRVDNTMAQQPGFKVLLESMQTRRLASNLIHLKLLQETCPIVEQSRVEKKIEEEKIVPPVPASVPSESEQKEPAPKKKRTKPPPDTRIKPLIDYYFQAFLGRCGFEPTVNGGVWGKIFKRLLRDCSEQTIKIVIDEFFAYDKRTRFSIYDFERSFDNVYGRLHDMQEGRKHGKS